MCEVKSWRGHKMSLVLKECERASWLLRGKAKVVE